MQFLKEVVLRQKRSIIQKFDWVCFAFEQPACTRLRCLVVFCKFEDQPLNVWWGWVLGDQSLDV